MNFSIKVVSFGREVLKPDQNILKSELLQISNTFTSI